MLLYPARILAFGRLQFIQGLRPIIGPCIECTPATADSRQLSRLHSIERTSALCLRAAEPVKPALARAHWWLPYGFRQPKVGSARDGWG